MKKFALIPYVCGAGASTLGCEQGPVVMKQKGLAEALAARGIDAQWACDPEEIYNGQDGATAHKIVAPLGDPARKNLVLKHCETLRDHVEQAIRNGQIPITLGGDHAMGAGSVSGFARAHNAHGRIGLLWIDAHADLNTPATSPSQAFHGMPVGALLGMGDTDYSGLGGGQPVVRPEHIFYLGLRDVDPGEIHALDMLGIKHLNAQEVHEMGYAQALATAIAHISKDTDYLFLSLDIDVFDPQDAPAVGTPVPEGFRSEEFLPVLGAAIAQNNFAAFELTEFNPTLPGADKTYELVLQALGVMLGAHAPAQRIKA